MIARFDQCPIASVRLGTIVRDWEHVSPRVGFGAPRVSGTRVAEFKQMLVEDLQALPEPICVESAGSLILADGHHRVAALEELAREYPGDRRFEFVSVRLASTPPGQSATAYAYEVALECSAKGPLPLTRREKHAAILRLGTDHPDWSDREIARRVGVDHKTVASVRRRGISPLDGDPVGHRNDDDATSPDRVARIAVQLKRGGMALDNAGTGEVDLSRQLAAEFRACYSDPNVALLWAAWWERLWNDVQAELEAGP